MIRATYPNARPSHLKNGATSSSRGVKSKQLETVPPANISAHVGRRIQSTTKESRLSKIVTLTTNAITTVESTLDKLKEARAINVEAGRNSHA